MPISAAFSTCSLVPPKAAQRPAAAMAEAELAKHVAVVDIVEGVPQGKALDLFEATPVLRTKFGDVLYFFLWVGVTGSMAAMLEHYRAELATQAAPTPSLKEAASTLAAVLWYFRRDWVALTRAALVPAEAPRDHWQFLRPNRKAGRDETAAASCSPAAPPAARRARSPRAGPR